MRAVTHDHFLLTNNTNLMIIFSITGLIIWFVKRDQNSEICPLQIYKAQGDHIACFVRPTVNDLSPKTEKSSKS